MPGLSNVRQAHNRPLTRHNIAVAHIVSFNPKERIAMYCMYCGTKLADDANFCTKCGKPVVREAKEPLPEAPDETAALDNREALSSDNPSTASSTMAQSNQAGKTVPLVQPEQTSQLDQTNWQNQADPQGDQNNQAHQHPFGTSLKNAMEQTKQRSRRRMPLVVIVALALALAAGTAFAAHYVYTTFVAPHNQPAQEQPTQDAQPENGAFEQEQPSSQEQEAPSEEDTLAAAQAEAAQAYENVLDSYRTYIKDVQSAPDDEAMLMLSGDIDNMEYPNVYVGDFLFGIDPSSIALEYAYQNIDGDSIDELFIRQSIDDPSYDTPIICAFDFNDEGYMKRFGESIVRGGYYITEDGQLINRGSGGFDTNTSTLCSWNGDKLIKEASVGYTYVSDADRGNPDSPYELTTLKDGHELEETVTYSEATEALQTFNEEHPIADDISWKKL